MGGWNVECFVNCVDTDLIHASLIEVFRSDGYRPCEKPSEAECHERTKKRLYENFSSEPLWGVAVFPCIATGWSFLHCDPVNLLCERDKESKRPRLAALAAALKAVTFQLNVEDSTSMVLMESTALGEYNVFGDTYDAASEGLEPPYPFFDETIHNFDIQFCHKDLKRFKRIIRTGLRMDTFNEIGASLSGVPLEDYDEFSRNNGPFIKYEKFLAHKNKHRNLQWDLKPVVRDQIIANAYEYFFRR